MKVFAKSFTLLQVGEEGAAGYVKLSVNQLGDINSYVTVVRMDKEQKEIEEGIEVGSFIFNALCKATRGTGIEVMVEVEVRDKQEDFIKECISYQIDLDITRGIMVVLEEEKKQ